MMAEIELTPGNFVEIEPLSTEDVPVQKPFTPTVEVRKITDVDLLQEIIGFILDKESTMTLSKIYRTKHSPLRTQLFLVKMNITTEVSVHLVRHAGVGQFHYASSNRPDWCGHDAQEASEVGRQTPVRHVMLLNAEHLMQMANARLCTKALAATRSVMSMICSAVNKVDPDLGTRLVPKCFAQGGLCFEDECCGLNMHMIRQVVEQVPEQIYRDWRNEFIVANYQSEKKA
jgi:hypothetical protein